MATCVAGAAWRGAARRGVPVHTSPPPQVCELDIIFSFHKAYALLDEVLLHGELQEANKREVLRAVTVADEKVEAAQDRAKGKSAIASI